MEISFEVAKLIHEAIAYTVTKTSYFITGEVPLADDVNSATSLIFCKFQKMKKVLPRFGKKVREETWKSIMALVIRTRMATW